MWDWVKRTGGRVVDWVGDNVTYTGGGLPDGSYSPGTWAPPYPVTPPPTYQPPAPSGGMQQWVLIAAVVVLVVLLFLER